jgi:hypothetical protein
MLVPPARAVPFFSELGYRTFGFLNLDLQLHVAYGIVGGVNFLVLIDPTSSYRKKPTVPKSGGFTIGYRLPQVHKRAATEAKGR